jgi:aryl-alcohol dehydrogenase-like predicted oxidoreductase
MWYELVTLQEARHLAVQRHRQLVADCDPAITAQKYFSLLGRYVEHELVPLARHAALGLLPWSPLAGGFLSGKCSRASGGGRADRRTSFEFPPIDRELGYRVLDCLEDWAARLPASVAQVALAWLLAKPHVTSVIVGASRFEQLDANLGAIDLSLPPEALADLDALTAPALLYPNWMIEHFPDETTGHALGGR